MTPAEHAQQRAAVQASLLVDSARLTLHDVYPARRVQNGPDRGERVPGASLAGAVAFVALREVPRDA